MARWPLALVLLLLTGCAGPTSEKESAPAASDAAGPDAARGPDVFEFDGSLLGAGFWTDATGGFFAGSFSVTDSFTVREGATSLRFDLTWDHPAPHAMWLHYVDPAPYGDAIEATPEEMLARSLTTTLDSPLPGTWDVTARATGPAAEVAYHITVTVDYST